MKITNCNKMILAITLIITAGVFLLAGTGYAEDKPQYVPNEIIVKFKKDVADTLERAIIPKKGAAPSKVSLTASLDSLNQKHRVKKFKQIINRLSITTI